MNIRSLPPTSSLASYLSSAEVIENSSRYLDFNMPVIANGCPALVFINAGQNATWGNHCAKQALLLSGQVVQPLRFKTTGPSH